MNRLFSIALTTALGLGASPAWSIIIDDVDVGSVDNVIAVTSDLNEFGQCTNGNGNSSDPLSEECWAEGAASIDLIFSDKTEIVSVSYYSSDMDIGAFILQDNPEYYIVKNSQTWVLMENLDDMGWGVVDGSQIPQNFMFNFGDATVSHVTEFDGDGNEVAEPASLALLGAGIVGFGLSRRRRRGARKASA